MCEKKNITASKFDILSSSSVIFFSNALLFVLMCKYHCFVWLFYQTWHKIKLNLFNLLGYSLPSCTQVYGQNCSQKLQNCTKLIYPYLHNVNYMFPASIKQNDELCK